MRKVHEPKSEAKVLRVERRSRRRSRHILYRTELANTGFPLERRQNLLDFIEGHVRIVVSADATGLM